MNKVMSVSVVEEMGAVEPAARNTMRPQGFAERGVLRWRRRRGRVGPVIGSAGTAAKLDGLDRRPHLGHVGLWCHGHVRRWSRGAVDGEWFRWGRGTYYVPRPTLSLSYDHLFRGFIVKKAGGDKVVGLTG